MIESNKYFGITADTVKEYSSWAIIKRIMSFLRPYRLKVATALILSLFSAALLVVRPFLIKVAIDDYITVGNLGGIGKFMVFFSVVVLLRLFVGYFLNMLAGIIGQNVMHDLRMKIFTHILSMEMSFFDHNKVGRLMTRTTDDVATLNELYTSGAVRLINNSGILVGIVIMMFFLDWKLSLVTLTVSPLVYLAASLFARKIRAIYRNIRKSTARLNAFMQESIQGIRIIKQMMRIKWRYNKFSMYSKDLMTFKIANVFQYGMFFPLMEFIGVLGIAIVITYGGNRIYNGTLQLGVMVAFPRLLHDKLRMLIVINNAVIAVRIVKLRFMIHLLIKLKHYRY